jgi:hypothetical protein
VVSFQHAGLDAGHVAGLRCKLSRSNLSNLYFDLHLDINILRFRFCLCISQFHPSAVLGETAMPSIFQMYQQYLPVSAGDSMLGKACVCGLFYHMVCCVELHLRMSRAAFESTQLTS